MRTIRTKVYKFNELSETAKEKALHKRLRHIIVIPSNYEKVKKETIEYLNKYEFYSDGTLYNQK